MGATGLEVLELPDAALRQDAAAAAAVRAVPVLEQGGLVLLPERPFALSDAERLLLDPAVLEAGSKNVSRDPASGRLGGTRLAGEPRAVLAAALARYAEFAHDLLTRLAPSYGPALQQGRTSFRPGPVETRVLSPRKDDRRLHVDAFPANPVQGRRILRVFTNVDPQGRPRVWNLGEEEFAAHAERFRPPFVSQDLTARARESLGLTKGRRTPYDAAMLHLHDRAKLDEDWQAQAPRRRLELPAGASWIVYTDGVPHAAIWGQHAFEQTYLLPVEAMAEPERSPLRVLEHISGRTLV